VNAPAPHGTPRVSVVTPAYNDERYLPEAIESVLRQTYTDFELILVNDGSTDSTGDIIASQRDDRIVAIHNARNLGLSASLNIGFRRARGSLLARLDSDDLAQPHRLARQVAFMDAQPSVGMVGSWFTQIDDNGSPIATVRPPADPIEVRWRFLFHSPIPPSTAMLRTDGLETPLLHDESLSYAMDYELWCRIARTSLVTTIEEVLVQRRRHAESMTSSRRDLATEEPTRIAVNQMRQIARGAGLEADAFDARFRAGAEALLWRPHDLPGDLEVLRVVHKLFRLHDAFSHVYGLSSHEARDHRRAVRARLTGNLISLTRSSLRARDVARSTMFLATMALASAEVLAR
jgi:glycosyltransferase involved in cell wall biosynthesis